MVQLQRLVYSFDVSPRVEKYGDFFKEAQQSRGIPTTCVNISKPCLGTFVTLLRMLSFLCFLFWRV